MDRGLGDDADADIAFDQAADGVEATQLHTQPKRTTDTVGLVGKKALNRTGAIKPHHVVVEHFGEGYSGTTCKRMVLRHNQPKAVATEWKGDQAPIVDGARNNA